MRAVDRVVARHYIMTSTPKHMSGYPKLNLNKTSLRITEKQGPVNLRLSKQTPHDVSIRIGLWGFSAVILKRNPTEGRW